MTTTERKIFKFEESAREELVEIVQDALLGEEGSENLVEVLQSWDLEPSEEDPTELIFKKETTQPYHLSMSFMASLSKAVSFALMTKSNFGDLLNQMRLEVVPNTYFVSTTPEYEEYFDTMIKKRLEAIKEIAKQS